MAIPTQYKQRLDTVLDAFKANPERALNKIGLMSARYGTFVCPFCASGSHVKGTGLYVFIHYDNYPRFRCFAACDKSYSIIDLVAGIFFRNVQRPFYKSLELLELLYHDEVSEFDHPIPEFSNYYKSIRPSKRAAALVCDNLLMDTHNRSIRYREACPEWQKQCAEALHLPVQALSRVDVGKSFCVTSTYPGYSDDGASPRCGDLVFYNMASNGIESLKVRNLPGVGYCSSRRMSMLDPATKGFRLFTPADPSSRMFRMAGSTSSVCFGSSYVTDDTRYVVIVEGQSDVLACYAATLELNMPFIVAIGRHSAGHRLGVHDIQLVSGKDVIYCEDADSVGNQHENENLAALASTAKSVRRWLPPSTGAKDLRDYFLESGSRTLIDSLLSAPQVDLSH